MKSCRNALAAATLALAGAAFAQAPTDNLRSAAESPDGSRPADGAIKGGSIVPGESGGLPNASPGPDSTERRNRCNELSGALRDDCLL